MAIFFAQKRISRIAPPLKEGVVMKNMLYYRELHCWVKHEEAVYLKIRRMRQRVYAQRHDAQECFCKHKQLWLCDGVCDGCEFYKGSDEVYFPR